MGDLQCASTVIAAIFWAKCQMGWRATRQREPGDGEGDLTTAAGQVIIVGLGSGT
jgi:hypothetical protein